MADDAERFSFEHLVLPKPKLHSSTPFLISEFNSINSKLLEPFIHL
jgi:hypothetical protein